MRIIAMLVRKTCFYVLSYLEIGSGVVCSAFRKNMNFHEEHEY